jgi:hypothetical protein
MNQINALPINSSDKVVATEKTQGGVTPSTVPSQQPGMGNLAPPRTERTIVIPAQGTRTAVAIEDTGAGATGVTMLTPEQRARLLTFIYYLASTHPAEMERFLDKFPEQSRLAIRRMIQDAKDNYPQLIEKLERQRNGNSK